MRILLLSMFDVKAENCQTLVPCCKLARHDISAYVLPARIYFAQPKGGAAKEVGWGGGKGLVSIVLALQARHRFKLLVKGELVLRGVQVKRPQSARVRAKWWPA